MGIVAGRTIIIAFKVGEGRYGARALKVADGEISDAGNCRSCCASRNQDSSNKGPLIKLSSLKELAGNK